MNELNQYLQPQGAPVTQNQGAANSYDFDADNERSAISGVKLRNFSFNAGTGGTIQLGGTSNQDGLLVVKNAAGSTIVTINNSGVTVEGGNVTIKNSGGTTILDGTGLVSTANFLSSSTTNANARIISSASRVDVSNTTLTTASYSRSTKTLVVINAIAAIYNNVDDNPAYGEVVLNVDGTDNNDFVQNIEDVRITGSDFGRTMPMGVSIPITLGTGTHTFKLRSSTGAPGFYIYQTTVTYLILGS